MKKLAILISGRGSNMRALAQSCQAGVLKGKAQICAVLSNRAEALGLQWAQELGLYNKALCSQIAGQKNTPRSIFESALLAELTKREPDLIVLAGFDHLLSASFVDKYPRQIINIHPADPAQFRGLHAYRWAWRNKLTTTTITVHRVDKGMDTGPVLAQAPVDLRGALSLQDIEARGLAVEHRLYSQVIAQLC